MPIARLNRDMGWYVTSRMRDDDHRELVAATGFDLPHTWLDVSLSLHGVSYCILAQDGEPVAVGGLNLSRPGLAQAWMWATERIHEVALELTRHSKRVCDAAIARPDIYRIQAESAAFHKVAHKWLRAIGFTRESTMKRYGAGGENFYQFVRI